MTAAQYRALRERLQLTRPETAELLGVHRQSVWLWETGERTVPAYIARLLRLIEHLGLNEARRILDAKKNCSF